ncbi:MAG: Cys-Gln thioester bond-forming surface protein [Clostridia bacterium]|nr:Cys-Gln thioester bond-forming surface protein [Clostridia bacterium]
MKRRLTKKIVAIVMVLITMISTIFNNGVIASTPTEANIKVRGRCGEHLQYYNEQRGVWSGISAAYVEYEEGGVRYPAYCLQRELIGVGTSEDEYESYTVDLTTMLDDVRVWRTIINGYPYKTPEQLGLVDEYDAFLATKQAVYCILYDFNPETRYRGADERGTAIANAIVRMVNEGRYGTQTPYNSGISIDRIGELKDENEYYSQEYNVYAPIETSQYTITSNAGLPSGTIICDMNDNIKTTFIGNEHFKIKIPKASINSDINAILSIQAKCKTYPVFYGRTRIEGTQNYAVTYDPYGDISGVGYLDVQTNTGSIRINKSDSETLKPIANVTFQLANEDGTIVSTAITDENGVAVFNNLYAGNYKLKELATDDKYILTDAIFDVNVEFNKQTIKNITNDCKRGNLKIYKVDKDNNNIALGNVEFDLYSEELQKVVGTYFTDVDGIIEINNIRVGEYKLIEKKTGKWYNLSDEKTVGVEWDITSNVTVENELKRGQIRIIKVDEDNNEIKIPNVKFEVLDSNNKVLETIITDENGEALTSRYAIRDYSNLYIKEITTDEKYVLDDTIHKIELKENEIVDFIFENKRIPEIPETEVEKTGDTDVTANQEMKYEFKIRNKGNAPLTDFTWYDFIPTDYVTVSKLITGTYNQDINYSIYYKTNKNEYRLLQDNLNAKINNYIDFSTLELESDEYITEFRVEFGKVDIGFSSIETPQLYVKVKSNVKNNDTFVNKTKVEGYHKAYYAWDEDEHTTKVYEKKVNVKLPKTGM